MPHADTVQHGVPLPKDDALFVPDARNAVLLSRHEAAEASSGAAHSPAVAAALTQLNQCHPPLRQQHIFAVTRAVARIDPLLSSSIAQSVGVHADAAAIAVAAGRAMERDAEPGSDLGLILHALWNAGSHGLGMAAPPLAALHGSAGPDGQQGPGGAVARTASPPSHQHGPAHYMPQGSVWWREVLESKEGAAQLLLQGPPGEGLVYSAATGSHLPGGAVASSHQSRTERAAAVDAAWAQPGGGGARSNAWYCSASEWVALGSGTRALEPRGDTVSVVSARTLASASASTSDIGIVGPGVPAGASIIASGGTEPSHHPRAIDALHGSELSGSNGTSAASGIAGNGGASALGSKRAHGLASG